MLADLIWRIDDGKLLTKSVLGVGDEPDARFTSSNGRVFLARVRTSLAPLIAGVALETLLVRAGEHSWIGSSLACHFGNRLCDARLDHLDENGRCVASQPCTLSSVAGLAAVTRIFAVAIIVAIGGTL